MARFIYTLKKGLKTKGKDFKTKKEAEKWIDENQHEIFMGKMFPTPKSAYRKMKRVS